MLIQHLNDLESPLLDPYRELKRTNLTRWSRWFIAEGRRVVERLLASSFPVYSVLLAEKRFPEFARQIPETVPILVVPDELCHQLVGFEFHTGIMACGARPTKTSCRELEQATPGRLASMQTLVACPNTTLPDNLGSIIRLSAAFAVDGLLAGAHSADPFSRRAIRVSMGTIFQMPVWESRDLLEDLRYLKSEQGFDLVAANQSSRSEDLRHFHWRLRSVILLGNEADGLSDECLAACDRQLEIAIAPDIDSLNVSAATAVLLYERQRSLGFGRSSDIPRSDIPHREAAMKEGPDRGDG